jgi:hypothetical protein
VKKKNSKSKSKIIVISKLRPRTSELNNSDILFLNEGCKLYKTSKEYKYELYKNNSVLNYLSLKQYDFDEIIDKYRNLEIWRQKNNHWELINRL